MDRRFFIHSNKKHRCYCANCGKIQLQDHYNYKKHGVSCGFTDDDNFTPVKEGQTYGYRWSKEGQKLRFSVCLPYLRLRPGFTDRYQGGYWKPVFEAEFSLAQKNVEILRNNTDMNLDEWIRNVEEKRLVRIQTENETEVIRSVFPGVFDVWNLEMFVSIYRKKGYRYVPLLSEETARKLVEQGFHNVEDEIHIAQDMMDDELSCFASVFKEKSTGAMILRLIVTTDNEPEGFLFSRKYYKYSYRVHPDLRELFSRRMRIDEQSRKVIRHFASIYPCYYLNEYLDTDPDGNVLIPLLSSDYHTLYELMAKAGLANIAWNAELEELQRSPREIRNLKDTFGLPVSILRRLNKYAVDRYNLETVRKIYKSDASYLDFTPLRDSMLSFLRDVDPTHVIHQNRYAWTTPLTKQQHFRILRYLEAHPVFNYNLYRDYLSLCYHENNYEHGLIPEDLQTAHDALAVLHGIHRDQPSTVQFELQVHTPEYQRLATDSCEEDRELFGDDEYLIRLPQRSEDLYAEGAAMHNCVRIYTSDVCRGTTRIVFLRQKRNPEKSFGTIEVSSANHLLQAKAFANRHLDRKAQFFVRKWVKAKDLYIDTRDLSETDEGSVG